MNRKCITDMHSKDGQRTNADEQITEDSSTKSSKKQSRNAKRIAKLEKAKRIGKWPWGIFTVVLTALMISATAIFKTNFGNVPFSAIIFHIMVPLEGTGFNPITNYGVLIGSILGGVALLYFLLSFFVFRKHKVRRKIVLLSTCLIFLTTAVTCFHVIGGIDYIVAMTHEDPNWQKTYVDPKSVKLTFPTKPRNVIYVVMESMETTYADKSLGGMFDVNMIPKLTKYALDNNNISFSHDRDFGGLNCFGGLTYTATSLVAQMSGLPLKVDVADVNAFRTSTKDYLPGATMIGDILKSKGYYLEMFMGSEATFASRDQLYRQHGNFVMTDYRQMEKDKVFPKGRYVFWGLEDRNLFAYAKKKISKVAENEQPFFIQLLTVDTHFPDGYYYPDRNNEYGKTYADAISWSDYDVSDFVEWCKKQEFYDNTTLILVGDHLCMNTRYFKDVSPQVQRKCYNVIINSAIPVKEERRYNRNCSVLDMFPTTLAAMGVKIEGDRLGYGTNLFSDTPTWCEFLGEENVAKMFSSASQFYRKTFHETPYSRYEP